jgi:hypothetical protein
MNDAPDEGSKIHVDADWKSQAQAEREKLAQQEAEAAEKGGDAGRGRLPEADFKGLMGMLTSQALMYMGTMQDQQSGGVIVDLEVARHFIDLLAVLEDKTKGNLDEEEQKTLSGTLNELRVTYVELAKAVAAQGARQGGEGGGAAPGGGGGSPIITE